MSSKTLLINKIFLKLILSRSIAQITFAIKAINALSRVSIWLLNMKWSITGTSYSLPVVNTISIDSISQIRYYVHALVRLFERSCRLGVVLLVAWWVYASAYIVWSLLSNSEIAYSSSGPRLMLSCHLLFRLITCIWLNIRQEIIPFLNFRLLIFVFSVTSSSYIFFLNHSF